MQFAGRPWQVFLVAAAVGVVSGCLDDLPVAHQPTAAGTPWQDTSAQMWVLYSAGCGFCAGVAGEHHATILYRDGSVLEFSYSRGDGGEGTVKFDGAVPDSMRARVTDIFAKYDLYGKHSSLQNGALVSTAHPVRLATDDASAVAEVIAGGLVAAQPPTGTITATDCGPAVLQAVGSGAPSRARVEFGCGIEGGAGWQLVEDQMELLHRWAA